MDGTQLRMKSLKSNIVKLLWMGREAEEQHCVGHRAVVVLHWLCYRTKLLVAALALGHWLWIRRKSC